MQPAIPFRNSSRPAPAAILALFPVLVIMGLQPSVSHGQNREMVSRPVASPPGSEFTHSVTVILTTATPDAVIRFTLDGTDPSTSPTSRVFQGALEFRNSASLKAIATRVGMQPSQVLEATYTRVESPRVSMPIHEPAFFQDSVIVRIEAPTPGARIFYTLDGTTPTRQSPQLTGEGLVLKETSVVKFIAVKEGSPDSEVVTYTYVKTVVALHARGASTGGFPGKAPSQFRRPAWTWQGRRLDGSRL